MDGIKKHSFTTQTHKSRHGLSIFKNYKSGNIFDSITHDLFPMPGVIDLGHNGLAL